MSEDATCFPCRGTGMSTAEIGKLCRYCYGIGKVRPDYFYRTDGRVEQECEHGIGHTVSIRGVERGLIESESNLRGWWAHGCDGCCEGYTRYNIERSS